MICKNKVLFIDWAILVMRYQGSFTKAFDKALSPPEQATKLKLLYRSDAMSCGLWRAEPNKVRQKEERVLFLLQ